MPTMRRSAEMNSISSGMRVFFIQNECSTSSGKTQSMPWFWASVVRYIRPRSNVDGLFTTSSATPTVEPSPRCTVAVGPSAAQPSENARTIAHSCTWDPRGISERMLNAIAFFVVLLTAVGVFLYQVWGRFNLLRAATGPFTLDRISERIRATLVYAFGQEKFIRPEVDIVKERTAGWLHFIVFWGFVILGIQIVTMFGRAFSATFYPFPFTPGLLGKPYWLVRDLFEAAVFVCILILLARWLVTQPRRLFGYPPAEERHRHHSHWEAYLILGCIGMITFSAPVYDGSRLLAHGVEGFVGDARWEPFSYLMSRILARLGGPGFVDAAGDAAW